MHGPFPCGRFTDIRIFRRRLKHILADAKEMCEADLGYRGEPTTIRTPHDYVSISDRKAKTNARARHETVNGLLKNWQVLTQKFRHERPLHRQCFVAVAVLTQITFEQGDRPWQVRY